MRTPLGWLGALLILYLLIPILAFLFRLGSSPETGFNTPGLWGAFGTSVAAATISTAIIALLGIPLGYLLARAHGPLATAARVVVQLPLALPPLMSGIILIYLVGPYTFLGQLSGGRLTESLAGIVIAQTFVASPFLVISARSAFAAVDPALDDLAAALGHGALSRFWRVALPSASTGIRAGLVLAWLRALGEYGATVLLAYHPYSLPVFTYVQFSGIGIPNTQAPTALALGIAVIGVAAGFLRLPRLRRGRPALAEPRTPGPGRAVRVTFDLDVRVGGFRLDISHRASSSRLAILGPSGSGKSVTLRTIAGLLASPSSAVLFEEADAPEGPGGSFEEANTGAPRIGYLPQGGVLFPKRTVWQQVTFGVGADPHLAAWWLETLRLDGLEDRMPEQLSGGQRQRVAFAQALSRAPDLVLLDEPFSALDAPVRQELRAELRRLQHERALSTVLVTHDPEEAALLADDILVIENGQLLQSGTRRSVYQRPASPRVAALLGIHNLAPGVIEADGSLRADGIRIALESTVPAGTAVLWCIRPESVRIADDGPHPAIVVDSADLGATTTATLRLEGGPELVLRSTELLELDPGQRCRLELPPASILLWPSEEALHSSGIGRSAVH